MIIKVWEQASPGFPARLRGIYNAPSFDDAVAQMLREKPALTELYRKEGEKHFLDRYQLFETEKEAKVEVSAA